MYPNNLLMNELEAPTTSSTQVVLILALNAFRQVHDLMLAIVLKLTPFLSLYLTRNQAETFPFLILKELLRPFQ